MNEKYQLNSAHAWLSWRLLCFPFYLLEVQIPLRSPPSTDAAIFLVYLTEVITKFSSIINFLKSLNNFICLLP
jgi:hypothetical protein